METEICRLELVRDEKRSWVFWWEARQPTPQGEKIIFKGPENIDEFSRARQTTTSVLLDTLFGGQTQFDKQLQRFQEQVKQANIYVVAQLAAKGWEPTATDQGGHVSLMKRAMLESETDPSPSVYNNTTSNHDLSQQGLLKASPSASLPVDLPSSSTPGNRNMAPWIFGGIILLLIFMTICCLTLAIWFSYSR
jgi:hypothetical protein